MENQVLEFIKKVQSIAQIGLSFSTDPYAIDNYEELRKISIRMLKEYTSLPDDECELYKDFIYPTPQPAVRTLVVRDNKLLLVKEKDSGLWSLPGGWCDIDCTPKETAIKETYEESGYVIECTKLLAVFDRRHYIKKSLYDVYCLYFLGNVVAGEAKCNHETEDIGWFEVSNLPSLSRKNSIEEIQKAYHVYKEKLETYFE
ncbi:MAG: NUDIX domain-containing protein [Turicibacter sp.]|jgi:8-oxo-dGTP diphosphatase|uniref:DNA mismatch repair protein MutT n=1 Tax=Turicibacter faecis TaxID=2963365 RepID=A0ABN6ZDI6_9FIRM|nr:MULTISPECIES: NUDIX hydrolase N-terminal domain-containing protein [unclassified Turicibacter]MCI8702480.1 NUDIX domain-containing protein [Turicibacter sp.]BEH90010.1 DNA mismatch repair protein MutT [Turicibacter sp. TC023]MCU7205208.1 NUDIX hydrolase N-terminal domain-containing protein [Turicibacter sp. TA25]MCU7208738.1 NUDIX hydrolase N-terminal domain-containing protein [Turicibacter sp. 1E2]NCE79293.1 NUDIX domain-containing protein [Turicibacter sp. TS3]